MKLDRLYSEGWEELGIQDPGFANTQIQENANNITNEIKRLLQQSPVEFNVGVQHQPTNSWYANSYMIYVDVDPYDLLDLKEFELENFLVKFSEKVNRIISGYIRSDLGVKPEPAEVDPNMVSCKSAVEFIGNFKKANPMVYGNFIEKFDAQHIQFTHGRIPVEQDIERIKSKLDKLRQVTRKLDKYDRILFRIR